MTPRIILTEISCKFIFVTLEIVGLVQWNLKVHLLHNWWYRVKVGNIAHMVWFAHFLFTDSAYIAHAFQCINHIVLSDKCQCYEYPWCYKSPEDDNPIYRLVRRTTAFPGGRNSLLSAWSLVFVIETIVISVQNICRSMLIRVSICTYYFK